MIYLTFLLYLFLPQSQTLTDSRDGQQYQVVTINNLQWTAENLRYRSPQAVNWPVGAEDDCESCGLFYPVEEAFGLCPDGWRLPTEAEVKALIKMDRKGKINLTDTLHIQLCGRHDNGEYGRFGTQNTFWIDAELKDGYITHWHLFGEKHELHNHNVVNARRKFPVRCVCELDE